MVRTANIRALQIGEKRSADDKLENLRTAKRSLMRRGGHAVESAPPPPLYLSHQEMAAMKDRVYARCEKKRKMYTWSKCPKVILDPLIERILGWARVTSRDTFLDIGSGIGNVVETVATRVGCRTIGVEVMKPNHEVAVAAAPLFDQWRREEGLPTPQVEYINADIRKVWRRLREEATVVWFANKLMPFEIDVWTIGAIEELRPGTRIVMMKDLVPHTDAERCKYFTFDVIEWGAGDVEWTQEPGKLFMYTRTDYVDDDALLDESTMSSMGALSSQSEQISSETD